MQLSYQDEFEQRYQKVLAAIPIEKREQFSLSWATTDSEFGEPLIPVGILLELNEEKLNELKALYQKFQ